MNLDADKAANVKGSTVVAGKDINITGENVSVENSNSIYNAQEKHEFKRTGLSVSVGGAYVDVVNNAANSVKHATEVEDKRLGALVAVKGYKDADKAIKNIKGNGGGKVNENLSINVSLGTTKSKSESNSTTTVANASEVKAGGDVNVTSTKKDIDITGSNVEGKDVTLNAKENLNITASKNTNKTEQNSKSSSASVGASLELGKGPSYSISGSMSKGEVSANGTTYNESTVKADKNLDFTSGKDTNIKGGMLSGEKVTGNVGNDLNIESKQDSNSYKENNKSVGASVGLGNNKTVSGSLEMAKELAKRGYYFGFGGTSTYKNAQKVREVMQYIPKELLLFETDSPYLTPVPFRGKRNNPGYTEYTARNAAEVLGMDFEELAVIATANTKRLFWKIK